MKSNSHSTIVFIAVKNELNLDTSLQSPRKGVGELMWWLNEEYTISVSKVEAKSESS